MGIRYWVAEVDEAVWCAPTLPHWRQLIFRVSFDVAGKMLLSDEPLATSYRWALEAFRFSHNNDPSQ